MFTFFGFIVMCGGLMLYVDAATTPGRQVVQSIVAGAMIFMPYWIAVMRREE